MGVLKEQNIDNISSEQLDNIATNIELKLKLLDIKLPKLAQLAEVDYFTLRKIINREINYLPNLRILIKLSQYFNISTGDLLKSNNMPQYIPVINLDQTEEFLNGKLSDFELQNKVFSDTYIHEQAFCIRQNALFFNITSSVNNICYPVSEFYKSGLFLVSWKRKICFIQLSNLKNGKAFFSIKDNKLESELIEHIKPLAMVVKFLVNQSLL